MQKAEAEHAAQHRELVDDHVRRVFSLGTAAALDRVPTGLRPEVERRLAEKRAEREERRRAMIEAALNARERPLV